MAEEAARHEHRPRLGRGLAALLGSPSDDSSPEQGLGRRRAAIEFLRPNPHNPRKAFAESELDDLATSIRERGVIQPILVRPTAGVADAYEIVAGERRWRAAQRAGLHDVPVIVLDLNDRDALAVAIIENVQRADLNALEEAGGYTQLMEEHGYSPTDMARILGKSRSHIANTLRLLKLPDATRALLASGEISAGHARALLALPDPDAVARRIVAEGLTVRDVERLSQPSDAAQDGVRNVRKMREPDADTLALQQKLGLALGARVVVRHDGESGEIRIHFNNFEQLDDFCRRLCQSPGSSAGSS